MAIFEEEIIVSRGDRTRPVLNTSAFWIGDFFGCEYALKNKNKGICLSNELDNLLVIRKF